MREQIITPEITKAIKKYHNLAVDLSDDLYAHPELPLQEFCSSQKIVEILRRAGYEVEYPYLGYDTGFRAVLDNGEGPSAAILVEYDALPGLGHACGHNVHGAMSVLAALVMTELKDSFRGKVVAFGTPAEEEAGAKVVMARKGVFDDMCQAVMVHSTSGPDCVADMDLLSLTCYLVEFKGVSAHAAASPWKAHSALAAARKFLDLIDARRECFTPDIRVNAVITDGGKYPNIIPDRAEIRMEFRTDSMGKLKVLDEAIQKCARAAAMALDCEVSFTEGFDGFADMVRVPALEEETTAILEALGRSGVRVDAATGSSDVGNTSYRCPTIQPLVSICETPYALHTPEFRDETVREPAHKAIADGGKLLAELTLRALTDAGFREKVAASYKAQLAVKMSM